MANCPKCNSEIPDSATECPACGEKVAHGDTQENMANGQKCDSENPDSATECPASGEKVIRGDTLEKIVTKTTTWQKIVIVVGFFIILAIAFSFEGAKNREDQAAQKIFSTPLGDIIKNYVASTGLGKQFGAPTVRMKAGTNYGNVYLEFPRGPLSQKQASVFAQMVCASLAKTYVNKGYMPRNLRVYIICKLADGRRLLYGRAVYNGSFDRLSWQPAAPK